MNVIRKSYDIYFSDPLIKNYHFEMIYKSDKTPLCLAVTHNDDDIDFIDLRHTEVGYIINWNDLNIYNDFCMLHRNKVKDVDVIWNYLNRFIFTVINSSADKQVIDGNNTIIQKSDNYSFIIKENEIIETPL